MTKLYYSNVSNLDINKEINNLPSFRIDKVNALSLEKDKRQSIGAYLLLKNALLINKVDIKDYKYTVLKNGKPILEKCPLHFSISHSGEYVAVAISSSPVGVDIQIIKPYLDSVTKLIFNEEDQTLYESSLDKNKCFFEIWTKKEAILKRTGSGLAKPMKDVDLAKEKHLKTLLIDEYVISISSIDDVDEIKEIKL